MNGLKGGIYDFCWVVIDVSVVVSSWTDADKQSRDGKDEAEWISGNEVWNDNGIAEAVMRRSSKGRSETERRVKA